MRCRATREMTTIMSQWLRAAALCIPATAMLNFGPSAAEETLEEKARRIHAEAYVLDTHTDTTPKFEDPDWDFTVRHEAGHVDIPRLREGGYDAVFWSIYMGKTPGDGRATKRAIRRIDSVHEMIRRHPDILTLATTAEDIRQIARRFVEADDGIVNMLKIKSVQQVLLRVRIAEMQLSVVKELGFNSNFSLDAEGRTGASAALSTGKFAAFTAGGTGLPIGQGVNQTFFPNAFGTFQLQLFSGLFDSLSLLINYLERQGLVKTLAEPNLTAVSGENANFLVGGEFPVPSGLDSQGNVVIQFRQFGVVLTFTPVVLDSGLISIKISTEVSTLSFETQIVLAGVVIPGLSVNRAETTVEMPSGGSLVIAGLLQDDITDTIEGFPGLKDIPILGALFRSTSFQKKETELVISVTPYLIRPISQTDISLPTDGFAPASDFDRYLLGRLHKVYSKDQSTAALNKSKGLMGPVGYIME